MSPSKNRWTLAGCFSLLLLVSLTSRGTAQTRPTAEKEFPEWEQVEQFVHRYFAKQSGYKADDLITRGRVGELMKKLSTLGWVPSERKQILSDTLEDNSFLVQQLNGSAGRKFLGKTKQNPLIYSQLDRLTTKPGGKALVRDLIRLPDGEKYAAPKRPNGVPGMVDLLPKYRVSKQQSVKDFGRPTSRIYTEKHLVTRLKSCHTKDKAKQVTGP